jgi:hypothetical protein
LFALRAPYGSLVMLTLLEEEGLLPPNPPPLYEVYLLLPPPFMIHNPSYTTNQSKS